MATADARAFRNGVRRPDCRRRANHHRIANDHQSCRNVHPRDSAVPSWRNREDIRLFRYERQILSYRDACKLISGVITSGAINKGRKPGKTRLSGNAAVRSRVYQGGLFSRGDQNAGTQRDKSQGQSQSTDG
jgi:hypothetical protein